ncbi:LuxR C-terminal-related transcriptional regulator [Rhodoplanes elegans]|nr:LuxR C-terminal-related transcriptional regulator [Rhodoplanes elegans]
MRQIARLLETLSALPLNVAVVGPDGLIGEVNRGWRDFAAANGLRTPDAGVGTNYFEVCDADLADSLRELVARRREVFTCVYPCHAPDRVRWMLLVALPLQSRPPTGLMIMHLDFTGVLPADLVASRVRESHLPEPSLGAAFAPFVSVIEQTILRTLGGGSAAAPPRPSESAAPELAVEKAQIADRLAARQREVLALLGQGKSNAEIADLLGISMNTAKLHVAAILRRLGLGNRMQAVASHLLAETAAGIQTLRSLQERAALDGAGDGVPFGRILHDICERIAQQMRRTRVFELVVDVAPDCRVPSSQVVRLALLTSELVINAIKHAHPAGLPGLVEIACRVDADGTAVLTVLDDGIGLPVDFDPVHDGGFGLGMIRALARPLGAILTFESTGLGLLVTATVPPPAARH